MSKLLVILGAGASKEAGAPVMDDFLDRADALRREASPLISKSDFDAVSDLLIDLERLLSRSLVNLRNLEDVLNLVTMAQLSERMLDLSRDQIERSVHSLDLVLAQTIEASLTFPSNEGKIFPPLGYAELAAGLHRKRSADGKPLSWSFISFNYDIALEYALNFEDIQVDYSLPEDKPNGDLLPLLKLHGSLNWASCSECHHVRALTMPELGKAIPYRHHLGKRETHLQIVERLATKRCCGKPLPTTPLIVPPSWNKARYYDAVAGVWKRAAVELAEAENIAVVGFSMPMTDSFFRDLFALGVTGRTRLRRFVVINPDAKLQPRFEGLLGPTLRERFEFLPRPFTESVDFLLRTVW